MHCMVDCAYCAMADSSKGVLDFLEQLRKERDELDVLIAGIERRIGITPRTSTPADREPQPPAAAPTVKVTIGDIPLGFFHNLSQPAAAEKLLRLNPGQPLSTQEMLNSFRKSGLHLNPKNAAQILYTALSRNPKFERVAGKAWGLAEWYSDGKKKSEAKRVGRVGLSLDETESHAEEEIVGTVVPPEKKEGW